MRKKLGLVAIFLVLLVVAGYWGFDRLGGNNPISVLKIESSPESLAGRTYSGIPQNEKLALIFEEMETQKGLHPGTFIHTIYEVEPAGKLDTMIVFVGINQALPLADLEFKKFEEQSYLLAKISGSRWVMPGPDKVKSSLENYAKENGLTLSGIFIDKIISEEEVHVIAPIY
jgi:hypothetical protein